MAGLALLGSLAGAARANDSDSAADTPPPSPLKGALPTSSAALPPSLIAALAPGSSNRSLVRLEAVRAGLPPEVADAVTEVESGYHVGTIGAAGEIGLMQVMPGTARMLGFSGSADELATPAINIHYGVTYLAQAWRLAGGDICTATMKYRAGHGETRFSYRSVDYCQRVRAKLAARGYPVTGTVPAATFGAPSWPGGGRFAGARGRSRGIAGHGPDLAGLNAKLRAVSELTHAHLAALR
jgi:soluble lytic murein transglycosylase-like protein